MEAVAVYSLVIPVYKNQDSLADLLVVVDKLNIQLDGRLEAVFVVDGSPDDSAAILRDALPRQDFASRLIVLSRNFGSFAAIRVGLQHATGEYFAMMAADLQEPPELVMEFFTSLTTEEYDVVIGTRESRADPLSTRLPSTVFWAVYRKFVSPQIPKGGVDAFGCNRVFRDTLLACEEANTSLIALLFWLGFRRKAVAYDRQQRVHGTSAWTLRKKVRYLMDSVFAFTDLPIKVLLGFGGLGVALAVVLGLVVLVARVSGWLTVPGYAATMLVVLFFGGVNTLGLGLIGSYAWRGYENTKKRPLAIVLRELAFPGVEAQPRKDD
ncbi:glycosyltransferase family 2 protein [Longispora urticae]